MTASSVNEHYHITEQAASLASKGAAQAVEVSHQAAAQISALNDQYKFTDNAQSLAAKCINEAARLGKKDTVQTSRLNEEHLVSDQEESFLAKATAQVVQLGKKVATEATTEAGAEASTLNERFHIGDKILNLEIKGVVNIVLAMLNGNSASGASAEEGLNPDGAPQQGSTGWLCCSSPPVYH